MTFQRTRSVRQRFSVVQRRGQRPEVTKRFPPEERYALTGPLRRSSHSPCPSLREAWAKRRYRAHFISKLTDADGENGETDTSLDMAHDCGYITAVEHAEMTAACAEIGRMPGAMIKSPQKFLTSDLRSLTSWVAGEARVGFIALIFDQLQCYFPVRSQTSLRCVVGLGGGSDRRQACCAGFSPLGSERPVCFSSVSAIRFW